MRGRASLREELLHYFPGPQGRRAACVHGRGSAPHPTAARARRTGGRGRAWSLKGAFPQ